MMRITLYFFGQLSDSFGHLQGEFDLSGTGICTPTQLAIHLEQQVAIADSLTANTVRIACNEIILTRAELEKNS